MYLMNAPPVAAIHTKWRSCGPPRGFSLPLCFNDSDSELSTTGTPIPDKVQMIIESLRSTQSSLDMGDEVEENVLAGQEAHLQGGKLQKGSSPKCRDPIGSRQLEAIAKIESDMQDSDSDDSVDRGIEEAIQEYLKEKDDHKRKAELTTILSQPSKIPRTGSPFPEIQKQNSNSNNVLTAGNQAYNADIQRSLITPAMKILKNNTTLKENPCAKKETAMGATAKSMPPAVLKSGTFHISTLSDKVKFPLPIQLEDNSSDSSSDDGIEEAIQRYQLEKKEEKHEGSREACKPLELKAESDSSSDDGIEEAILCYQLEQKKEHKSVLAPCIPKQKPLSNVPSHYQESTSREDTKTNELSKKKKLKSDKDIKSPPTPPTSISFIKDKLINSPKGKGVNMTKQESISKLPSTAPLKANTTAELMCAEAILDISKAVMPKIFNPPVGLRNSTLATASTSLFGPSSCMDNNSDDSSVDSEDGIEQEIREFLEQKAQMHKQPTDPASTTAMCYGSLKEADQEKEKQKTDKTKALRLSLTQKRRHKEQDRQQVSKGEQVNKEDTVLKPLSSELDRRKPSSGEKSSSLDSDEDLDTAIKDLLKTKKKLKKKARGMKLKARKGLADEASSSGKTLPGKKLRSETDPPEDREKILGGRGVPQLNWSNRRKESPKKAVEADLSKGSSTVETPSADKSPAIIQIKEESSSVDSDDSIELEIRKFLAEKAKGSACEEPGIGAAKVCSSIPENLCKDFKLENQLAEIPVKHTLPFSDQSPSTGSVWRASDYKVFQNTPSALLTNPNYTQKIFSSTNLLSSPCPVDPVDGAVVAKTERKRRSSLGNREKQSESIRGQPLISPNTLVPRLDSERWHQSRAVPEASSASLNRPPFQSRSSHMGESPSTTPVRWRANANPETAHISSSMCSNRTVALFHSSPKTTTTASRSPFPNPLSPSRSPVRKYFMQGLETGGPWGQLPTPRHTESMLHMARDQNMFVQLAPNMTNHVQVRSSETSEGRDRRPQGEAKQGKECESERARERGEQRTRVQDCVDETECESDERSPEKRQGFSALSLSSAIEPGLILSPYIALNTEERRKRFHRMWSALKRSKKCKIIKRPFKKKLTFIPTSKGSPRITPLLASRWK